MKGYVGYLLAAALGVVFAFWLMPKRENIPTNIKKEVQRRDSLISVLKERHIETLRKLDSLSASQAIIEYRYDTLENLYQNRRELPFAIDDTSARYSFFANRFPNLLTHPGN